MKKEICKTNLVLYFFLIFYFKGVVYLENKFTKLLNKYSDKTI